MKYSMKFKRLVFALFLAGCGVQPKPSDLEPSDTSGIVGGEPVPSRSEVARHVVAVIGRDGSSEFLCTGVLVGAHTVLTAGHCGVDMRQGVILFSNRLDSVGRSRERAITRVVVQPTYLQTLQNLRAIAGREGVSRIKDWGDLSLMDFDGPIPVGYVPISLSEEADVSNQAEVLLAGYGLLDGKRHIESRTLNEVEVTVKKSDYSRTEFEVDQSHGQGACHGDSGGPAFVVRGSRLILVGITSRGINAVCTRAGIYTKVLPYKSWIGRGF